LPSCAKPPDTPAADVARFATVVLSSRIDPEPESIRGGIEVEKVDTLRHDVLPFPAMADLARLIVNVPDWPKPGVVFKDITPLLRDPAALSLAVEYMAQPYRGKHIDVIASAESRGFIFGVAVAQNISAGFVPIRKPGKLPREVLTAEYALEYGVDKLQIHADALKPGDKVLLIDDVLATGGTMTACCKLVEDLGAEVAGIAVLIELGFLHGRETLGKYDIHSVIYVP
jgi:adenine phosphoribosyltransferase